LDEIYTGQAPVLWLQGADCTGCSVSLLNSYPLMPVPLLTKHISLKFHQTLSSTQGAQAAQVVNDTIGRGGFVLVVEGAIPVRLWPCEAASGHGRGVGPG
jgi:hydrogenase small subunit